jgi:sterol desaturase/sphingolipid hydroxylase (fatty acid hydroxylase superfamily)
VIAYPLAFLIGALTWTLCEYWIHRTWGHRKGRNPFTVEHLHHHADVMYFAPWYKKLAAATVLLVVLTPLLTWSLGAVGLAGVVGFVLMYLSYELIHYGLHVARPRTRYGRWARRHHLYHHFKRPHLNHGVTSPLWDIVFGTLEVPGQVGVPRKQALPWMLTKSGDLDPRFAGEYQLVGRPAS